MSLLPSNPNDQPSVLPPHRKATWWILAAVLLVWNLAVLRPWQTPQAVVLPYSEFVGQVRAGNVSSVHLVGAEITGSLRKPVRWPPPPAAPQPSAPYQDSASTPAEKASSGPSASPRPTTPPSPGAEPARSSPSNSSAYTLFSTTFPHTVGDTALLPLLEEKGVQVDVAPEPSPLLQLFLSSVLPLVFLVALLAWMGRHAAKSQAGIFGFGRSKARRLLADRPDAKFPDVAGADEAKADLAEVVDFLRSPDKYYEVGAKIPRGVLLVGPPGTGKTLLARAVAGEAGVPFFNISASEFVEMFVGVGASRVRDLFEQAKTSAPAIIFIDEMDAVGRRRGAGIGAVNDEREQTLNQLLVEMDGFDERHEVIVIGATNRPDVLDPALLRPGRFDRQVIVGLPDRRGREGILVIHSQRLRLAPNVDLSILARATTGLSGADLANLCNEAALAAARHGRTQVDRVDFEEALDKMRLGGERPPLLDPRDRRVVAYHEAGHALAAWLTPDADPVHKVTIVPHGRALGVTEQLPGEDRANYSKSYLLARLTVMLGGRAAEEIAVGDVTTGAENDLMQATRLAQRMVSRWAMGNLGTVVFQTDEESPFLGQGFPQGRPYSETTAALIDQDVSRLMGERHEGVLRLLTGARGALDRLVEELLHEETVGGEALARILGPLPTIASAKEVA